LKTSQELSRLNLYPSLESLAPGKYFTEDSPVSSRNLVVSLERKKLLPGRVEQMVEKYSERWKSKGFYESAEIAGVTEISYPRAGERESEALHLVVRPFRYFAFLATNANVKLRNDLEEEDREWLLRQTENYDPNEPIPAFVNPLSVDVLLLCDEERKFVLTRRSGHTVYRGGLIGPSAAETVSTSLDQRDGEIDLVNAVRRALNEEIGIQAEYLEEVYFTDLLFDKRVFDYKLSCVATTNLTAEQIEALYRSGFAKDKYETTDILFPRFPCEVSRNEVLANWTPEAAAAYTKAVIDRRGWKKLSSLVKE
jgi:hypothetical protein